MPSFANSQSGIVFRQLAAVSKPSPKSELHELSQPIARLAVNKTPFAGTRMPMDYSGRVERFPMACSTDAQ